jgi:hypothetical protein
MNLPPLLPADTFVGDEGSFPRTPSMSTLAMSDESQDSMEPRWSKDICGSRIFIHGAAGVAHEIAHRATDEGRLEEVCFRLPAERDAQLISNCDRVIIGSFNIFKHMVEQAVIGDWEGGRVVVSLNVILICVVSNSRAHVYFHLCVLQIKLGRFEDAVKVCSLFSFVGLRLLPAAVRSSFEALTSGLVIEGVQQSHGT